jgi:heme/copper-type cytochrome/quinol oxidase subunit 3
MTTAAPQGGQGALDRTAEEAGFYHEAGLGAAWTGSRLAIGGLTFLFGSFVFAYFYLRSLNSNGRWHGSGFVRPSVAMGTIIIALIVISAVLNTVTLQRIKAGNKKAWQTGGWLALLLGLAAVALMIIQLLFLPFYPGSSGYSSVFVGTYPVYLTIVLVVMIWLETLLMRSRALPAIHFVEQPPTFTEAFAVQRYQANLSSFTAVWNYMAVVGIVFWVLFYLL